MPHSVEVKVTQQETTIIYLPKLPIDQEISKKFILFAVLMYALNCTLL